MKDPYKHDRAMALCCVGLILLVVWAAVAWPSDADAQEPTPTPTAAACPSPVGDVPPGTADDVAELLRLRREQAESCAAVVDRLDDLVDAAGDPVELTRGTADAPLRVDPVPTPTPTATATPAELPAGTTDDPVVTELDAGQLEHVIVAVGVVGGIALLGVVAPLLRRAAGL